MWKLLAVAVCLVYLCVETQSAGCYVESVKKVFKTGPFSYNDGKFHKECNCYEKKGSWGYSCMKQTVVKEGCFIRTVHKRYPAGPFTYDYMGVRHECVCSHLFLTWTYMCKRSYPIKTDKCQVAETGEEFRPGKFSYITENGPSKIRHDCVCIAPKFGGNPYYTCTMAVPV